MKKQHKVYSNVCRHQNGFAVRRERGFVIAAALLMSIVVVCTTTAAAAMMMPSLKAMMTSRFSDVSRAQAEAALDWSVCQLNDPNNRSSLDGMTVGVPSTVMSSGFSGTVECDNIAAPTYSYLYDPLADVNNSVAGITGGNGWRTVTATVTNGVYKKKVRVILKPIYQTGTQTETTTTTVNGPAQGIFTNALFSQQTLTASGGITTNSFDPTNTAAGFSNTGGNIGSNTAVVLDGTTTIGGNVAVDSIPAGSTTQTVVTSNGVSTVSGAISSNGLVSGVSGSGGTVQSATNAQQLLPPVPSAPSTATNLGTVNLTGKQSLNISQPGDYVLNSLSMSGQSTINITADGPVNFYIQGSGSSNGISIAGQGITNSSGDPANFRIWYGGSGNVNLTGQGGLTGVIYAPNAPVKISGLGALYGAAIGNSVNIVGGGAFHYDRNLSTDQSLMWNPPITKTTTTTASVENLSNFQVVSWLEL
ncbi:MAG TPA: hypothetical protein V6D22_18045 [Candidatus Obscuribacterales bacterium]